MRHFSLALVTSLALLAAACVGSDDDDPSPDSAGGTSGAESTGDAGDAGRGPGTGGSINTGGVEFTDLPGKIRFINFVSDGTAGVNLDLYWGTSIRRSEKVGAVEYGEITEFITPRHSEEPLLDPDEARYFLVREGDVTGTPASFLVQNDPTFTADTVLTVALAAADPLVEGTLVVSAQTFDEAALSTPPAGMAHVYYWSVPFAQIPNGNFVLLGTETECEPEQGEPGGANLGFPALIPAGSASLALFDANTTPPCDSGTPPVTETVEEGRSYVLLAQADSYELDARQTVLLELGTE